MDRESPVLDLFLLPSPPPVVLRSLFGSREGAVERATLGTDMLALGEVIGTVLGIVILAAVGIAVGVTVAKNHSSNSSTARARPAFKLLVHTLYTQSGTMCTRTVC